MPRLFLCGDVMTGRGVDQILAHPCSPAIQEPWVRDAREYVALAERANGPIARPVSPTYIWGDALAELERLAPDARIINLETSVTTSDEAWPGKAIYYRMHPFNVDCLTAADVDVCVLANNHVLDYGRSGLEETICTLSDGGLTIAGAGDSIDQAREPAMVDLGSGGRLLVFAVGVESSGIPTAWAAAAASSGVHLLRAISDGTADELVERVHGYKRHGDIALASIHWGDNWGYEVSGRACPLRTPADRRRRRSDPRPLVTPSAAHRNLQEQAGALWVRRLHHRLRRHQGTRAVSRRPRCDVRAGPRARDW
jgi:poly-gamma-glutamate capsule biosynthesis protein CapA/YwtB (metallophosphatase superfamily)